MRKCSSVLLVVLIGLTGYLASPANLAAGEEKPLKGLGIAIWRISSVQPATKESKAKDPKYLGSIFVEKSNAEPGETGTRMWLRITTETKFGVTWKKDGAKVEDLTKGMIVSFEFSGTTNSLPPTGFATELSAMGTGTIDQLKKLP